MTASAVCSNSSLPVSSCAASNVGGSKRKAKVSVYLLGFNCNTACSVAAEHDHKHPGW